jgi:hypothetical protein
VKKISTILFVTALVAGASSANAWWNGPFNSNGFGNGSFDMSFRANANANGWGRHYGHTGPYGYYPYQGAAPALTEEQQAALKNQQEAFAEQEAAVYMQAREAHQKFMEQQTARFEAPSDTAYEDIQAQREKMRAQMLKQREAVKARHAAMRKAAEERRQQRNI